MGLIGAYAAIPIAVVLATYEGWLFRPSTVSPSGINVAVIGLMALVTATMLAEYAGAFERVASGRDALIGVAFLLGAVGWVLAVVRLVPDTRAGVTVLIGPMSALMLGGVFCCSRFAGTWTRSWTAAIMTVTPISVAPPISGSAAAREIATWDGEATQSGRINIPANRQKIALRLLGGTAAFLILAQLLRGTSYNGFPRWVFYGGAVILGAMAAWSLPRRAPALSLGPDGISIRRDLCAIRNLSWPEIVGFEMKSSMGNDSLVVHVKNADALMAQCGPISRWFMGQSQARFGTPVAIPISWLKCDAGWLWHEVNEMLATSRISHRPRDASRDN